MNHPNSKIKLVIFDLDGTLVDAYKAVSDSLRFAFKRNGLKPISDRKVKRSVGWGETQLVKKLAPADQVQAILKDYRQHHRQSLVTGSKFLPFALSTLKKLKKHKYKMAIVSNRPSRFTNIILRSLDMRQFFQFVICADKVKKGKPAPDMINCVLKKFNLKAAQTVYVGDMTIDVQAARAAKVSSIIVLTGSCYRKEIIQTKPFRILNRLNELFSALISINSIDKNNS